MTYPLNVAVVGAGFFSQFHYEAWHRQHDVNLIACCNRNQAKAQAMAKQYGIDHVYDDLVAMLDNQKLDVLDIVTPPETHLETVRLAAQRKLNVICQKPFGANLEEAKEIVKIGEDSGIKVIIHENFRFMPWYRQLKMLLDKNYVGQVLNVQFNLRPGDGQGPDAYLARQPYFQTMEKFLVHETAIHLVDTFRFLFGDIKSVYADLRRCNPVITGEDSGQIIFEIDNTLRLLFDGNRLIDHASTNTRRTMGEMWVEGTAGTLRLDGEARIWHRPFGALEETQIDYDWNDYGFGGDCVYALCHHAARHLLDGAPVENTGGEYLTNIVIENAIYLSNDEGRKISI